MIGTNLNLTLPQLGDTIATIVSKTATALSAIQTSIADKATQAGLNLNSDISFLGNRATNVGGVVMVDGNNPTAAGSIYYHSGEFYAIDATGTIKLTNLGALNASGIGGIGGDYGGVNPALESYDNTTGQYRFYTNGGTHAWADIAAHGLFLEGATNTTEFTTDNSVNANQVVPWGKINSTDLLAWDGAKIIPAGGTNTYGTGLKLGGDITYQNSHYTASKQWVVPLYVFLPNATVAVGFGNVTSQTTTYSWFSSALPVASGDQIVQATVTFSTVGAGTKTIEVHRRDASFANDATVGTASSTSTTTPLTIIASLTETVDTSHQYYIKVAGAASGDVFNMVTFSANRP